MDVGIQFDVDSLVGTFAKDRDRLLIALSTKIEQLSGEFVARVVQKLSGEVLESRSGKLAGTVRADPVSIEDGLVATAVHAGGPNAPYGIFQERGVDREWQISPTNKKALLFMLSGKEIFAMAVQHGPLIARRFMAGTAEEMRGEIQMQLESTARESWVR